MQALRGVCYFLSMGSIGWSPERTATHAEACAALARWTRQQAARQACAWCLGQGYVMERSALGWLPIACPSCVNHSDEVR